MMRRSVTIRGFVARRDTTLAIAVACLLLGWTSGARADSLSTELRFRVFTTSYRWSNFSSNATNPPATGKRSLYVVPALGVRFYPKNGHGALVDVDYRFDVDADREGPFLCIFDCPPYFVTEFAVAHAGYAYRHVIRSRRDPERLAWALTPHVSLSAGAAFSGQTDVSVTERSPVVGGRVGFDVDLHIKRFFLGWTLRYEILRHTKGSLRTSHFISWNVIPAFAIGAVIGRKVQPPRQAESPLE
jgi:hypothetical protein